MFEYEGTLAATVSTETYRIARGLRQRDVALLHALVGQYQYRLVRYFTYLLGRRDPVDDLVQETWLRVLERGHSYDGQSRFEPGSLPSPAILLSTMCANGESSASTRRTL